MNVLITGAQFGNKGAQSMLFTVVNEVRDRYPNAEFYYLPLDYYKEDCFQNLENYRFHFDNCSTGSVCRVFLKEVHEVPLSGTWCISPFDYYQLCGFGCGYQ